MNPNRMQNLKQAVYFGKGAKQNNTQCKFWNNAKNCVSPKQTSSVIKHLYTVTIFWLV